MLKKKWAQLTDEDLKFANGNLEQLVGRIQHRTGEAREAIEQFLEQLTATGSSVFSEAVKSVGEYARDTSGQICDGYNRISDRLESQLNRSEEFIRERPAHSVATAFAVGILFGVVVGLALRSRG